MMADTAKVKRNISRMIEAGAPEADIDAYLQSEGMTADQLRGGGAPQGRGVLGTIDDAVRMMASGATFGLADKFAGGMDALTGVAPSYTEGVEAQRAQTQRVRQESPYMAPAAEIAGGLGTGIGAMRAGLTLAGRLGPGLLPRSLGFGAEGATYGAAHGAGNTFSENPGDYISNATKGAATGAAVGAALPVLGSAASGVYRVGSAFLGPRVQGAGRGASAMLRSAAAADEAGLRNLPNLGPEGMLPDAGPSMLGLAQGAGTGTGQGRTALVNALRTRDTGAGPRLATALDQNLGPSPIPSRVETGLNADRALVAQEYAPLMANARAVNTQPLADALDASAVNLRGPAQQAVQRVRAMLDIPGAPGNLDPHPQALLSTRQAIDGLMATETNPQVIRQLTIARQAVDDELTRAVPGIKEVDARFAELSRQSGGLQRGSQVFDTGKTAVRPQELAQELTESAVPQGQMAGPSAVPLRMRQGARAELDRVVGTQANDLNALERKLATPRDWNSQKLSVLFGDVPAGNVAQSIRNERQMRQTFQDVVQNSQTAQRVGAARAMDTAAGGNIPSDITATALSLKAANALVKAMSGASNATTKDEIGRILASQGPDAQRIAAALLASSQTTNRNSALIARLLENSGVIGASGPVAGRR